MQATTTVNRTELGFGSQQVESSRGIRALQNSFLSELPGVTFAVITLVYIIASLVRL